MKYINNCILLILLIVLCVRINLKSQDFEVAPVELNFTADPEETQVKKVNIINHANKKVSFILTMSDMTFDEKGNSNEAPANSTKNAIADWLTITPAFFELNPNENIEVTVNLLVHTNNGSTKWGKIYVQTAKEQTNLNVEKNLATGIKVSPRIAISVTQSPKSNTNYKASISNLVEKKDSAFSVNSRIFNTTLSNTGDKILDCKIYLIATNITTQEETKYPPAKVKIFPGVRKIIELSLPADLPSGKYALAAILDYGFNNLEGTQTTIEYK